MKINSKYLQELCVALLKIKKDDDLKAILDDLLTPQELISLTERFQIMKELTSGKPQREIASQLKLSIGKITRGSRMLQFGKTDWKRIFSNTQKNK